MRNTQEIILDLKNLIYTKGYIYSLCLILFDDFHLDLNKIHEVDYRSKLSVKECSLIIGFLVQKKIDFSIPTSPEEVFLLKEKTYELMRELQISFTAPQFAKFQEMMERQKNGEKFEDTRENRMDFFVKDKGMMEPMFYGGDGVYDFQYLEYLELKYKNDSEWLIKNRGFNIYKIGEVVNKIKQTLRAKAQKVMQINIREKFPEIANKMRKGLKKQFSNEKTEELLRQQLIATTFYQYNQLFPHPNSGSDNSESWNKFYENLLDLFIVSPTDLKGTDQTVVESFFENFSFVPECNSSYEGPGHFNIINSRPLIKLGHDRYFVGIGYLVPEAVYESPFYWMWEDNKYRDTLAKHRGDVGEEIAYNFLSKVFGKSNTYRSIIIETKKGQRDTDIDVLCLLGNRALCVQVKSKKLTLTAKRGDFDQLSKDFNGAVQDAYNQGLISRKAILNKTARFFNTNGDEVFLPNEIDEAYIMGLTTENYPALVHQVHMMLTKESADPYPLFLSVFDLELLSHYLNDPYDFLYYVRQRIELVEYFNADEELVYLGYHLDQKLCRVEGYDGGSIDNQFGAIVDRNYYPYKTGVAHLLSEADDPILNRWKDPKFDSLVREIKSAGHPKTTDIIFHLLDWSGDSRKNIVEQMINIKSLSQNEGLTKSLATATPPYFGLNYVVSNVANPKTLEHSVVTYAKLRKYLSKSNTWLGMGSFSSSPNLINFLVYDDKSWHIDMELEHEYKETLSKMKETPITRLKGAKKIGRNDPCTCKSGKKYKKCCGR
ncbi:MAG: SEC-C domain-containing protein [Ferruginibacter sp.]|nr:SEC-C domain-containing protein [Ferruginibacter sp.]